MLLLGSGDGAQYVGEYLTEASSTPVRLLSSSTLHAIAAFENRADTSNNPVRYTFGLVVVAVRFHDGR